MHLQKAIFYNRQLFWECQPYKHFSIGLFYSLLLKEQWFAGWESQCAAKHARSCFNGFLAKYAVLHGSHIINHPNITGEYDAMYQEDGSLSHQGHVQFLLDIRREISKCDRLSSCKIWLSYWGHCDQANFNSKTDSYSWLVEAEGLGLTCCPMVSHQSQPSRFMFKY